MDIYRSVSYTHLEDAITISSFDKYIDSLQVIQLEASPQSFITYIKKVLITQNKDFIILNSTGVLVFSQAGNLDVYKRQVHSHIQPTDRATQCNGQRLHDPCTDIQLTTS